MPLPQCPLGRLPYRRKCLRQQVVKRLAVINVFQASPELVVCPGSQVLVRQPFELWLQVIYVLDQRPQLINGLLLSGAR